MRKIIMIILMATFLCGCASQELEDRCFPMLALVDYEAQDQACAFCYTFPSPRRTEDQGDDTKEIDTSFAYGDDFLESWKNYEDRLDKKSDDNHLKVVVLGEQFVADEKLYGELIKFLEERQSFPRNCYVCVIPNCRDFLEISGTLSDDAGNYLENYLKNHENAARYEPVTLGKLMDEWENRRKNLYIPYLEVQKGNIVWTDWYLVTRGLPVQRQSSSSF